MAWVPVAACRQGLQQFDHGGRWNTTRSPQADERIRYSRAFLGRNWGVDAFRATRRSDPMQEPVEVVYQWPASEAKQRSMRARSAFAAAFVDAAENSRRSHRAPGLAAGAGALGNPF